MGGGMDKTYFIQKTAMTILAHNLNMDIEACWTRAEKLYKIGDEKGYFPAQYSNYRGNARAGVPEVVPLQNGENDPERTDYRYPRNMHVRGEIEEDVPF